MIRPGEPTDVPVLQDIERAAGQPFRPLGMQAVADDEPPSEETLLGYIASGRAWVHVDEAAGDDRPVAYVLVDHVDGLAHIEQVSVHPDHARRRIGAGLIDHVARWARGKGIPALTLTTFTDVAWNGPYYERIGFRYLADDEVTEGLRSIRAAEAAHGLDRWPRACMRRDIAPAD
ncbi:MAG TPA: GNAT family N-acetyltransferase [Streptomyces sp.]|uniref:GNAT family N-acetyltransferase n=1 Tax=Streptomyces sp. TaxID=1931 RepID=UPI002D54049B|nr:GNAT family N-acetyltransferase [Streptomyces sp.]HZG04655.1 GNAT family N-acetyltransferase [Streptomyces sp.]